MCANLKRYLKNAKKIERNKMKRVTMKSKYKFIFLFGLFISISSFAMQLADDEEKQTVDKMLEAARPKYAKKAHCLMNLKPFSQSLSESDFSLMSSICKPQYAPLLEELLEKKIVCPNAFFAHKGVMCNLLGEAIFYSLLRSADCYEEKMFDAVRALLDVGAITNQACRPRKALPSFEDRWEKEKEMAMAATPLHRAVDCNEMGLASLLLQYKAQVNDICWEKTPLMLALGSYIYGITLTPINNETAAIYKMMELLLKAGADVNIPSKYHFGEDDICTPMQLAQKKDRKEIVALFEQYQRDKK